MQGGLEILELQLQKLPQAESLAPVVQRLLRTTARMSNTVRTLLMLARRPEEIEFQTLDCSALLWGIVREMEGDGLLHCSSASDRLPDAALDIISDLPSEFASGLADTPSQPSFSGGDAPSLETATVAAPRIAGKKAHDGNHSQQGDGSFFTRLLAWYEEKLDWVLQHQSLTLAVAVGTLVLTVLLYIGVPKGFFPVQDTGVIQGMAEAPQDTSFEAMAVSDGKPAVLLIVFRSPGANIIETVDQVKEMLPQLRSWLPESADLGQRLDRSLTIRASLREVEKSLALSM